jgi:hypothetical protein
MEQWDQSGHDEPGPARSIPRFFGSLQHLHFVNLPICFSYTAPSGFGGPSASQRTVLIDLFFIPINALDDDLVRQGLVKKVRSVRSPHPPQKPQQNPSSAGRGHAGGPAFESLTAFSRGVSFAKNHAKSLHEQVSVRPSPKRSRTCPGASICRSSAISMENPHHSKPFPGDNGDGFGLDRDRPLESFIACETIMSGRACIPRQA